MYYPTYPGGEDFLEDIGEDKEEASYEEEDSMELSDSDFELSDSEYPDSVRLRAAACCDDEGGDSEGEFQRCPEPEQVPDYQAQYRGRNGIALGGSKLSMRPFGGSGRRSRGNDMERMASDLECPDEDEDRCYMESEPRFNAPPLHTNPQGRRARSERKYQSYNVSGGGGRAPSSTRYANGQNRVLPGSGRSTQKLRGVMEDKGGHKYFVFQNKMPSRTTDKEWNHGATRLVRDRILMPDNGRRGINSNGDGVVWAPRPGATRSDPYMARDVERKAFDRYGRGQLENNMNGVFPTGSMRPMMLPPSQGKRWADYDREVGWQPVSRTPTTLLQDPHPDVNMYHTGIRPGLERQTGSMPVAGRAGSREGQAGPGMIAARPHVLGDPDFREAEGRAPRVNLSSGVGPNSMVQAQPSLMQSRRAPLTAGRDGHATGYVGGMGFAGSQVAGRAQRNPKWMENTRPNVQNVHQGRAGHGTIVKQGKERQMHIGRAEQNGVSFDSQVSMTPTLVQQGSGNKRKFFAAGTPQSNVQPNTWTQGSVSVQRNPAKLQMLVNQDPRADVQGAAHNMEPRGTFDQAKDKTQARLMTAPAPTMALRTAEMNRGSWLTGTQMQPKAKTQARLLASRGPVADRTTVDPLMRPSVVQQGKDKQLVAGRAPTQDQGSLNWAAGRPDQIQTGTGLRQPIVAGREGTYGAADAAGSSMRPSVMGGEDRTAAARDPQPYRTDLGLESQRPGVVQKEQNRGLENPQKLSLANGWTSVGYEAPAGQSVRLGKATVAGRRPQPTRNVDPRGALSTPVQTRVRARFRETGRSSSASTPQSVRRGKKGGAVKMRWATPQLPKGAAGWRSVAKYSHNFSDRKVPSANKHI